MTTTNRATIATLIAAERRDIRRYTWLLLLHWRASKGTRARWTSLRSYHQGQIERLRERL